MQCRRWHTTDHMLTESSCMENIHARLGSCALAEEADLTVSVKSGSWLPRWWAGWAERLKQLGGLPGVMEVFPIDACG